LKYGRRNVHHEIEKNGKGKRYMQFSSRLDSCSITFFPLIILFNNFVNVCESCIFLSLWFLSLDRFIPCLGRSFSIYDVAWIRTFFLFVLSICSSLLPLMYCFLTLVVACFDLSTFAWGYNFLLFTPFLCWIFLYICSVLTFASISWFRATFPDSSFLLLIAPSLRLFPPDFNHLFFPPVPS
jgi:hypothetical protein